MATDLPIVQHVDALRQHLTRYPPTEGFHLVAVREDGGEVAVVFRWRRNPHTFVIRFDRDFAGPFGEEDLEMRVPHEGAEIKYWCENIQFWLMEELDTGHLVRSRRHREGDEVVLTSQPGTPAVDDEQVWVDDVPQFVREFTLPWKIRLRMAPRMLIARLRGRPATLGWTALAPLDEPPGDGLRDGDWLSDSGLDPARVRAIRAEGRLLVWLQAMGDGTVDDPALGQCAVVATDDPEVALVEVLETAVGAPTSARQHLVEAAVHAAADEGAHRLLVPDGAGGTEVVDTALL